MRVSLNEGLTVLDLKPSNNVTLAHLREVIRNNGFVTKEAQVTANGIVLATGSDLVFEVAGSKERFSLKRRTGQQGARFDELRERAKTNGAALTLSGSVDMSDPKAMKMTPQ